MSPSDLLSKTKRAGGFVSYAVLGTILASAGGLGAWVMNNHADAGHERHDVQVEAAKRDQAERARDVFERLREHAVYENSRLWTIENAILRMERKQDHEFRAHGHQFPSDAPPLSAIPRSERPGFFEGRDPVLTGDGGVDATATDTSP